MIAAGPKRVRQSDSGATFRHRAARPRATCSKTPEGGNDGKPCAGNRPQTAVVRAHRPRRSGGLRDSRQLRHVLTKEKTKGEKHPHRGTCVRRHRHRVLKGRATKSGNHAEGKVRAPPRPEARQGKSIDFAGAAGARFSTSASNLRTRSRRAGDRRNGRSWSRTSSVDRRARDQHGLNTRIVFQRRAAANEKDAVPNSSKGKRGVNARRRRETGRAVRSYTVSHRCRRRRKTCSRV